MVLRRLGSGRARVAVNTNSGPGTAQGSASGLWVSSCTSQDSPGRSPLSLSRFQMCREDTSFASGIRAREPPHPHPGARTKRQERENRGASKRGQETRFLSPLSVVPRKPRLRVRAHLYQRSAPQCTAHPRPRLPAREPRGQLSRRRSVTVRWLWAHWSAFSLEGEGLLRRPRD